MAGLSSSRGVTVADDTSPVDTIFRPMISFLAFNMSTVNCSLSDCPWVSMRDFINGWACAELFNRQDSNGNCLSLIRVTR